MQAEAVAAVRSLSSAHAEELRILRETVKRDREECAAQAQARSALSLSGAGNDGTRH